MTTEHAIVYAKAFSSVPSMLKMLEINLQVMLN